MVGGVLNQACSTFDTLVFAGSPVFSEWYQDCLVLFGKRICWLRETKSDQLLPVAGLRSIRFPTIAQASSGRRSPPQTSPRRQFALSEDIIHSSD